MKWIAIIGIVIGSVVYCAFPPKAFAQQVVIYTGPNGQYLGQAIVMSPTQPIPPNQLPPTQPAPSVWSPNVK
jgi:hypothetical protein